MTCSIHKTVDFAWSGVAWLWKRCFSQNFVNFLLMIFTGCLTLITYDTERAYVVVMPTDARDFVVGGIPSLLVSLKNDGILPAYHAKLQTWCKIFPSPDRVTLETLKQYETTRNASLTAELTVFKDVDGITEACQFDPPAMNQSTVDAIHSGKAYAIFIWGSATYQTLWRTHHTDFCGTFSGPDSQSNPVRFPVCTFHNDAN